MKNNHNQLTTNEYSFQRTQRMELHDSHSIHHSGCQSDSENLQTKQETVNKIEEYLGKAIELIKKSELSNNYKNEFYKFIENIKNRKS